MAKKGNRQNITTIIHDLKESYARKFREKIPQNSAMDALLTLAAHNVKKGQEAEWSVTSQGAKTILFS